MNPPYELTPRTLTLATEIMRLVGRFEGFQTPQPQLRLRKGARVKTVLGSLAIEGNTLTIEQATALVEGRRVVGPAQDILALRNALDAYDNASSFSATQSTHLLKAHGKMMKGLLEDAGRYRAKSVGVFQGSQVSHVAPPAKRVPELVESLLAWLKMERKLDALVASAVVHYELEFIHPFSDGNGRMGRLWQHVILLRRHPIFQWIPVESAVLNRQQEYYKVLAVCDHSGTSTAFIEFSLSTILQALEELLVDLRPEPLTTEQRLLGARESMRQRWFSRKEYIAHWKTISSATASRDLRHGVKKQMLIQEGDRALARYRYSNL